MKATNRKKLVLLGFVFFVVFGMCISFGQAEAVRKFIKVGAIMPLTGPGAAWGIGVSNGMLIGAEDINAAGGISVGGKTYHFKVYREDDQYRGAVGLTKCQKLIYETKIDPFIATISSATVGAIQPITEPQKIILLCCSQGAEVTGPQFPYTFRALSYVPLHSYALHDYIVEKYKSAKRIAVISPNDASGWGGTKGATWSALKHGFDIVFSEYYERSVKDFNPLLNKLLLTKPDIVSLGASSPGTAAMIVKQIRELGYTGLITGDTRQEWEQIVKIAGPKAAEGFLVNSYLADSSKAYKGANAYYRKYLDRYGKDQWITLSTMGYWYMNILKTAIEKANSLDSVAVAKALKSIKVDTIEGPVSFGQPFGSQAYYPLPVTQIIGGKAQMVRITESIKLPMDYLKWEFKSEMIKK